MFRTLLFFALMALVSKINAEGGCETNHSTLPLNSLSLQEDGSVFYHASSEIQDFRLRLNDGAMISHVGGGRAAEYEFVVVHIAEWILGSHTFGAPYIPAGSGVLTQLVLPGSVGENAELLEVTVSSTANPQATFTVGRTCSTSTPTTEPTLTPSPTLSFDPTVTPTQTRAPSAAPTYWRHVFMPSGNSGPQYDLKIVLIFSTAVAVAVGILWSCAILVYMHAFASKNREIFAAADLENGLNEKMPPLQPPLQALLAELELGECSTPLRIAAAYSIEEVKTLSEAELCGIGVKVVHAKKIKQALRGEEASAFLKQKAKDDEEERSASALRSRNRAKMMESLSISPSSSGGGSSNGGSADGENGKNAATAALFAFLKEEPGLEKFTMAFVGFGFRNVKDLCDTSLLNEADLLGDLRMSRIQARKFTRLAATQRRREARVGQVARGVSMDRGDDDDDDDDDDDRNRNGRGIHMATRRRTLDGSSISYRRPMRPPPPAANGRAYSNSSLSNGNGTGGPPLSPREGALRYESKRTHSLASSDEGSDDENGSTHGAENDLDETSSSATSRQGDYDL